MGIVARLRWDELSSALLQSRPVWSRTTQSRSELRIATCRRDGLRIQHCHNKAVTTSAVSRIDAVARVPERRDSPSATADASTPSMCLEFTIVVPPFMSVRNDGRPPVEFHEGNRRSCAVRRLRSALLQSRPLRRGTTGRRRASIPCHLPVNMLMNALLLGNTVRRACASPTETTSGRCCESRRSDAR